MCKIPCMDTHYLLIWADMLSEHIYIYNCYVHFVHNLILTYNKIDCVRKGFLRNQKNI